MGKYKKLSWEDTGLPWHTGDVHTAKCSFCNQKNQDMFRRCKHCSKMWCSVCFNKKGFKHDGCSNGEGPFPTLDREREVLSRFDAEVPPRPADKPEPPHHSEDWAPAPTSTGQSAAAVPALMAPATPGRPAAGLFSVTPSTPASANPTRALLSSPAIAAPLLGLSPGHVPILNPPRDRRRPKTPSKKNVSTDQRDSPTLAVSARSKSKSAGKGKKRQRTPSDLEDSNSNGDEQYELPENHSGRTRDRKSARILTPRDPPDHEVRGFRSGLRAVRFREAKQLRSQTPTPASRRPVRDISPSYSESLSDHEIIPTPQGLLTDEQIAPTGRSNTVQTLQGMKSASGTIIMDVSKIDKLRVTLPEGYYTATTNSKGTRASLPTLIFYQYKLSSTGDEKMHLNYVAMLEDADQPARIIPQPQTVSGTFIGDRFADSMMARMQRIIGNTGPGPATEVHQSKTFTRATLFPGDSGARSLTPSAPAAGPSMSKSPGKIPVRGRDSAPPPSTPKAKAAPLAAMTPATPRSGRTIPTGDIAKQIQNRGRAVQDEELWSTKPSYQTGEQVNKEMRAERDDSVRPGIEGFQAVNTPKPRFSPWAFNYSIMKNYGSDSDTEADDDGEDDAPVSPKSTAKVLQQRLGTAGRRLREEPEGTAAEALEHAAAAGVAEGKGKERVAEVTPRRQHSV